MSYMFFFVGAGDGCIIRWNQRKGKTGYPVLHSGLLNKPVAKRKTVCEGHNKIFSLLCNMLNDTYSYHQEPISRRGNKLLT